MADDRMDTPTQTPAAETTLPEPIAVIGLAGRFPGADSIDGLWRLLVDGGQGIARFTPEELAVAGVPRRLAGDPAYVPARGHLADWDCFDAELFDIPPREAQWMDPQLRLLHECVWAALEDAGQAPGNHPEPVGFFVGGGTEVGWSSRVRRLATGAAERYWAIVLNDGYAFSTRIAYKLGFTGPVLSLQTACSSSLVALHLACRSLLAGECQMAIAAGVSLLQPAAVGYLHEPGMVTSPDGVCRPFDARAAGTLAGDGCGVVVLKRLADARADGETPRALVRGTAVNNDGRRKIGYTAPSLEGQAEVLRRALDEAGVAPETIALVEAHGTATPLGDPIEVAALHRVYGDAPRGSCALGSIKSNMGHLNDAAGITGFIKATLALEHRIVPPSLHFDEPNPRIDWDGGPFRVPTRAEPWPGPAPRRAAVSSFGIGGTNAHAVLEEAPARPGEPGATPSVDGGRWHLVLLSGRRREAVVESGERLARRLREMDEGDPADVAYTTQVGRRALPFRRAVVGRRLDGLARRLEESATVVRANGPRRPRMAWLLPGQGAQWPGMGAGLARCFPAYGEVVERCLDHLAPDLGEELAGVLGHGASEPPEALRQTRLVQPSLFVCGMACAALLRSLALEPSVLLGHSSGEWTAACLAGVFTLEDALDLVVLRGELMQALPPGAMLGVALPAPDLVEFLPPGVELAAINGPDRSVVSGPEAAINTLARRLERRKVPCRRLTADRAFHGPAVEPVARQMVNAVARVERQPPRIPLLSTVHGGFVTADEATDPAYWGRQLRQPVRFATALDTLVSELVGGRGREGRRPQADGGDGAVELLLIEAGPGGGLATLARRATDRRVWATGLLRRPEDPRRSDGLDSEGWLLAQLGELWTRGAAIEWRALHHGQARRRLHLPTYPFARRPVPLPEATRVGPIGARSGDAPPRLYLPVWHPAGEVRGWETGDSRWASSRWLLVVPPSTGRAMARTLGAAGVEVIVVSTGEPSSRLAALAAEQRLPTHVIYAPGLGRPAVEDDDLGTLAATMASTLGLARVLATTAPGARLALVTVDGCEAPGSVALSPSQAALAGLSLVLAQELVALRIHPVDVGSRDVEREGSVNVLMGVVGALWADGEALSSAHRLGRCWHPGVSSWGEGGSALYDPPPLRDLVPEGAVFLITGGLGELGMVLAEHLVATVGARLVLVNRPPQGKVGDLETRRAAFLERLRTAGVELVVLEADCTDRRQMDSVFETAEERFGSVHAVIHAAASTRGSAISTPVTELDEDDCRQQLAAKAQGLLVLHDVLRRRPVALVIVMSSLAADLGGLGLAAYSAANRFQDACVRRWSEGSATRWLAIGWDGWKTPGSGRESRLGTLGTLLEPAQGLAAFERILGCAGPSRVLVAAGDLEIRWRRWSTRAVADAVVGEPSPPGPEISSGTTEERLTALWNDAFGHPVDRHQELFELGGDSLLAIALVTRINHVFTTGLTVSDLLSAPTIARLTEHLGTQVPSASAKVQPPRPTPVSSSLHPAAPWESYPLSFEQEAILAPRNQIYPVRFNCSGVFEMEQLLDPPRLREALAELLRRHEILRTGFDREAGRQRTMPVPEPALSVVSCTPDEARRHSIGFVRPFALARPPLIRLALLQQTTGSSRLLVDLHHVVTDALSLNRMMDELWALYLGQSLDEVPLHYKDYAVWQRRHRGLGRSRKSVERWADALREVPWTALPPTVAGGAPPAHDRMVFETGVSVLGELRAAGAEHGVSLVTLLLAALGRVLSERSGQEDVGIGLRVSRRDRLELEGMLGPFVDDALLRIDRPAMEDPPRVLRATQEAVATLLDGGGLGDGDPRAIRALGNYETLNTARQRNRPTPNGELFTVLVNPLPAIEPVQREPLRGRFHTLRRPMASKYHLNLRLHVGERLRFDVKYRSDRYDEPSLRTLFEQVVTTARRMAAGILEGPLACL